MTPVIDGLRLISTSAVAYVTSAVLLGIAVVPAALRSYQVSSGNSNGGLELLVETLRVALVVAMIAIGRGWNATSLFAGHAWRLVGADVGHAVRTRWPAILAELAVVTLVALAFNAAVAVLIEDRTADAVTFAIKNVVVIPLFLMALLRAVHAVHPA